jgi:hypothetical protein
MYNITTTKASPMRRSLVRASALAIALAVVAATPVVSHASTAGPSVTTLVERWKLALDLRSHPNRSPFSSYRGGPAVWSLRESHSSNHDGDYRLLPSFSSTFGSSDIKAWHGGTPGCVRLPAIGVNTNTKSSRPLCSGRVPPEAAFARPSGGRLAIVQWTSPFDGTVAISHDAVADLDGACGDGVSYFVSFGSTLLATVRIANRAGTELAPVTQPIKKGQLFSFVVDPGPAHNAGCDTTQLQITIDHVTT